MVRARQKAKRYAEALPEEWPPFLIFVDVGHCIDLYADFSASGKQYIPFPDQGNYRLLLDDLADEKIRARIAAIWTDPQSLDPSRQSAKVTRQLAGQLARFARSLESQPDPQGRKTNTPEDVAAFLMRCLITMLAEDVGLIRG